MELARRVEEELLLVVAGMHLLRRLDLVRKLRMLQLGQVRCHMVEILGVVGIQVVVGNHTDRSLVEEECTQTAWGGRCCRKHTAAPLPHLRFNVSMNTNNITSSLTFLITLPRLPVPISCAGGSTSEPSSRSLDITITSVSTTTSSIAFSRA